METHKSALLGATTGFAPRKTPGRVCTPIQKMPKVRANLLAQKEAKAENDLTPVHQGEIQRVAQPVAKVLRHHEAK